MIYTSINSIKNTQYNSIEGRITDDELRKISAIQSAPVLESK